MSEFLERSDLLLRERVSFDIDFISFECECQERFVVLRYAGDGAGYHEWAREAVRYIKYCPFCGIQLSKIKKEEEK